MNELSTAPMAIPDYHATASVNTSGQAIPIYNDLVTGKRKIGTLYNNECFSYLNYGENYGCIKFRNSSGTLQYGYIDEETAPDGWASSFTDFVSNGSTLLPAQGNEHVIKRGPLRYYLGSDKAGTLPVGTYVRISDTCGAEYDHRLRLLEYNSNGSWVNPNKNDKYAWIDFLTLGSMPGNRAIW